MQTGLEILYYIRESSQSKEEARDLPAKKESRFQVDLVVVVDDGRSHRGGSAAAARAFRQH